MTPSSSIRGACSFPSIHFFNWLLSAIVWVIGLGSPTQHTVDVISVYYPAVLGALAVIPVYFIGKALFNRWAGVLAAALVAIMPGEFLGRSILGFTDYNVAETLFSTVAVLFLILAIKEAGQRQLTLSHFIQRDWKAIGRPLVYSLLAGIFLGIYLITWQGALLFVFIISLYFIIQFIIDHLRHKSSDHLGIVGFFSFLVALIIFLPILTSHDLSIAMVVALFIPLVLAGISRLISGRGLKPFYYPLTLVGIRSNIHQSFFMLSPRYVLRYTVGQISVLFSSRQELPPPPLWRCSPSSPRRAAFHRRCLGQLHHQLFPHPTVAYPRLCLYHSSS